MVECISEEDSLNAYLFAENKEHSEIISNLPPTNIYDRTETCGKGIEGLREVARVVFEEAEAKKRSEERDAEVLSSRFVEREPPIGTVIDLSTGKYRLKKTFLKGGGFMMLLQKVGDEKTALLACRGTAGKSAATGGYRSVLNNLQIEIGLNAIAENWDDIATALRESKIESLTLFGKSQGGAHAQMLAPLVASYTPSKVTRVVTITSVGVSEKIQEIFSSVFNSKETTLAIYYYHGKLEDGEMDLVPYLGGRHVHIEGAKSYSLSPNTSQFAGEQSISDQWFFMKGYYLLNSFNRPHIRQITLMEYTKSPTFLKNENPLFENSRKIITLFFHYITFGWLNPTSYEAFFESKKMGYLVPN